MAANEKSSLIVAGKRPESEGKQREVSTEHHSTTHLHHNHHHHHHHQPSARILHHWVHQFEKINASLDEHGQPIGQDGNRHGGKNSSTNGPAKERSRNREGKNGNEEDEEAWEAGEEDEEEEDDDDELCFKATQLVTELLLMLFAASLLIIAAVVIFSKNIPAFMKSYDMVPMFLFLMCIVVASVSFTRWLIDKVRAKFDRTFNPDVPLLLAEQKLVLPDGIRPVESPRKLVESIVSGPTSILVTVSKFRANVSDNLVSPGPATGASASYNKSCYNSGACSGARSGINIDTARAKSSTGTSINTNSCGYSGNNLLVNPTNTSITAGTVSSYIDRKCRPSLAKSNLINDSTTITIDEESNSLSEFT